MFNAKTRIVLYVFSCTEQIHPKKTKGCQVTNRRSQIKPGRRHTCRKKIKKQNKTKQSSPTIYSATATYEPSAALCTTATFSARLAAAFFFLLFGLLLRALISGIKPLFSRGNIICSTLAGSMDGVPHQGVHSCRFWSHWIMTKKKLFLVRQTKTFWIIYRKLV